MDEGKIAVEPKFNPIDLENWPRGQIFHYFSRMAPTAYSLTVELDITNMKNAIKERGLKFFPAYLWLTTTMLNSQQQFKTAYQDDVIGYWNYLTPLYATLHEDDKTISLIWTEYDESFCKFYKSYLENKQQYGDNHGILAQQDKMPPANCYTISALPWVEFKHFSLHSFSDKSYFLPTIEAGKYTKQASRIKMPLSITAHHATTDGWHIKCFLEQLQHAMNEPYSWILK